MTTAPEASDDRLVGEVDVVHRVLPGQTAWRIARAYGVPLERLAEANRLDDPTRIGVGDLLVIPGATRPIDVPPFPTRPDPQPLPLDRVGGPSGEAGLLVPVAGAPVRSRYGAPRGRRSHAGIDFDGRLGDAIVAAADGTVSYAGSGMTGYGRTVIVDHGNGWTTLYAHASRLLVREGEVVRRGEVIARVGRTGNATGTHCHFELRLDGRPVDPTPYLDRAVASRRR